MMPAVQTPHALCATFMAPRFYTPDTEFQLGRTARLTDKARHHAGRVLRMAAGERAVLFDGKGNEACGPISFDEKGAGILIEDIRRPATESPLRMTLMQALVSLEKMDWILEKAVEAGAAEIIVFPSERSVVKLAGERLAKRMAHWQDVIVGACEQCGRASVPALAFEQRLQQALGSKRCPARYILSPGESAAPRLTALQEVAFAVGPEGGFSEEEIALAKSLGWQPALIGPRVLRTETAGLVALALAGAASGDMHFV